MKPPNVTTPPSAITVSGAGDTSLTPSPLLAQQQTTAQINSAVAPQNQMATNNTNSSKTPPPSTTSPALIATQSSVVTKSGLSTSSHHEQQAPLALTTQSQPKPQLQSNPVAIVTQQQVLNQIPSTTTPSPLNPPMTSSTQPKFQPNQLQVTPIIAAQSAQPIALATAQTASGPTALVIIPQHSTTTSIASAKTPSISSKVTPISTTLATAHVALATTTQSTNVRIQSPITTIVPTINPVPITAHQQSTTLVQPTLINRPPQTLPVVPITAASPNLKQEPNRYVCCLLDSGVRCDRVAGNASFSARIQKIVASKKMNFVLDPTVRHTYICDHHKAIITVAKKSTNLTRETKANARNYSANNANPMTAPHNNFNEIPINRAGLQHPMNLEMLESQGRLSNNHASVVNNVPMRPGQISYDHYQNAHPAQVGSLEPMLQRGFDNTGGDSIASSSGGIDVDLQQLQVNTLRRYKRHFRVQTKPGLNKMQLAESLKTHFRTLPIIEKEAITYFVYIVKSYRNKLDQPNPKAE